CNFMSQRTTKLSDSRRRAPVERRGDGRITRDCQTEGAAAVRCSALVRLLHSPPDGVRVHCCHFSYREIRTTLKVSLLSKTTLAWFQASNVSRTYSTSGLDRGWFMLR